MEPIYKLGGVVIVTNLAAPIAHVQIIFPNGEKKMLSKELAVAIGKAGIQCGQAQRKIDDPEGIEKARSVVTGGFSTAEKGWLD